MKQYKYTINGAQFDVTIDSIVGSKAKVEVNGIPFEVEMQGSSLVEEALPLLPHPLLHRLPNRLLLLPPPRAVLALALPSRLRCLAL